MEYRGYGIERDPLYFMFKIVPIGRGSVHLSLRGLHTNIKSVEQTIDRYEDRKEGVNEAK